MYGFGYAVLPLRNIGPVVTDGPEMTVDDGVASSNGGYSIRQPQYNFDPIRRFLPRSIGVSVTDDPLPTPAPTPVPLPSLAPVPVPVAAVTDDSGFPWWVWLGGAGVALFAFKGAK